MPIRFHDELTVTVLLLNTALPLSSVLPDAPLGAKVLLLSVVVVLKLLR